MQYSQEKWVPVTTAWLVLRLRIKERAPICKVAANILNKQSRTADTGWYSSYGVGWVAGNCSPLKHIMLQNIIWCLIPELIHCCGIRIGTVRRHLKCYNEILFSIKLGDFSPTWEPVSFQEGRCSMAPVSMQCNIKYKAK